MYISILKSSSDSNGILDFSDQQQNNKYHLCMIFFKYVK